MNYENLRANQFKWLAKTIHRLFYHQKIKNAAELFYWRLKKLEERKFNNEHYEYFCTTFFGLAKASYRNQKILDIGCGPRGSLEWANNVSEKYGLDPLANQYAKMNKKSHAMTYVQGYSEKIPFADNYFDKIISFNSLDHVDDIDASVSETVRVLKSGGYFLLITDIHDAPTITEPSAFSWDVMEKFKPNFEIILEQHFEGHQLYKSIRKGIPFDHTNEKARYGILTALMRKI